MYEAYGEEFDTLEEAKKHVESLPYWGEAISKCGLLQTIWDTDGDPVAQRSATVAGIGCNRTVTLSEWYSL